MSNLNNKMAECCENSTYLEAACDTMLETRHCINRNHNFTNTIKCCKNIVTSQNREVNSSNCCKNIYNQQDCSLLPRKCPNSKELPAYFQNCTSRGSPLTSSSVVYFLKTIFFIIVIHLTILHAVSTAAPHDSEISRVLSTTGKSYITLESTSDEKIKKESFLQQLVTISSQRSRRLTRSAYRCRVEFEQFLSLAQHAYDTARSGFTKIVTKRHAFKHSPTTRTWEGYCLHTHEQLKTIYCESHRKVRLFGKDTDRLQSSIKSMLNFLQQEMNSNNQQYTSWSRNSCAHTPATLYTELQRKIVIKLHSILIGVRQFCH